MMASASRMMMATLGATTRAISMLRLTMMATMAIAYRKRWQLWPDDDEGGEGDHGEGGGAGSTTTTTTMMMMMITARVGWVGGGLESLGRARRCRRRAIPATQNFCQVQKEILSW